MTILFPMVRTREFDPTTALNRAMDVFASRGYSNTSMDDVVKATGVSRYGLYGTFGNKRELFEQALERYAESMGRSSFLKLLEPDATLDDIRTAFVERVDNMCEGLEGKGCLLTYTAMELAPRDSEIRDVLHRFMQRMSKAFSIGLEHARDKGEVKADLELKKAGEYLTGAFFGMTVMGRSGFDKEALLSYVDSVLDTLRS